jgi:tRNA (guanine-N7-)-methyltransferase
MAPQRHIDPFATRPEKLNPRVNPYVETILKAQTEGALPIAFGDGLRGAAGQWRERLAAFYRGEPAPRFTRLVVEVGCHKGATLIAMAKKFPDYGFIGIDITYKRVVLTAQRAQAAGLRNVFCIMANAIGLDQLFAPGELDGMVVFFPDPWVKKASQAKNRLVGPQFATRAAAALSPRGFLWFKTDQKAYFEAGGAALIDAGLGVGPGLSTSAEPLLAHEFSSTFEKRFHEQLLPTYGGVFCRGEAGKTC